MKNLIIPKLRLKLTNTLNKLILGKIIGNIPFSIIRDIKEVVELDIYKKTLSISKKLDSSSTETHDFPENFPMRFPRDKAYNSKYIYKVNNAFVSSRTGVIWTNSGKILLESVGSLGRLLGWGGVLVDILMSKSSDEIQESVIVCPDTGYYHWSLEVLPNVLHLLKNIEEDVKIVIPQKSPKYLTTALKYILKSNYENKVIRIDRPTKVKTVYFAYYEDQSGYVRKVDRDILKEYFLDFEQEQNNRKIYISRAKAPKRSIGNEKEVEEALKKEGFEIVYAEELNWIEQIRLYNSSSFIVAPHGAGLSNTVWCQKDTKILEVFPYNGLHFCFATLVKSNGLEYDYMVCEKDDKSSGKVNLNQLIEKVNSL